MAKSDPEAQRTSSLSDCTWLEDEFGSFKSWNLKFLMHFREPGSSLYFIFISYILIFVSHTYIFSFLSLSHFFLFFFSHQIFFICSPLNSKTALYLAPPPCLDVCSSSGKEVTEIMWVSEIFFLWRDTWNLQSWHHLAIFLELTIPTQW
jgi:hypothetical protein